MMRVFLFLLLFMMPSQKIMAAERFFESLYDIPVKKGLVEISEEAVSFDKPEGRVALAAAYTTDGFEDIAAFYQLALGQMGWQLKAQKDNILTFNRLTEILSISY
ncbi:MAG: hypothetical protein AAF988_08865, partial [Pseudomonadota bacterium]